MGNHLTADVAQLVGRYGDAPTVIEWAAQLPCSRCGGEADFVVTGKLFREI